MSRGWKNFAMGYRESLVYLEETVGRNMDIKGASGEVSKRKEEHIIRNWRKGDPCYKLERNLFWCFVKVATKLNI